MSESPITTKSAFPYQIAIFIFVNIWGYMCFEVAQYQLVTLYQNPFTWIGWATLVELSMLPVLSLCAWKLKDRVQITSFAWEFRIREVNLQEFKQMVKDYNASYTHLISRVDFVLSILFSGVFFTIIVCPFILVRSIVWVIAASPLILALLTIIFGLLFSYFMFKILPNHSSAEFPPIASRRFRKAIPFLVHIPGIFWAGIRLKIGESGGYYTMRDPIPVARIEGIEGIARIEGEIDSSDNLSRIIPIFESDDFIPSEPIKEITAPITPVRVTSLIRLMIQEYIHNRGGGEILEDVIEDIDSFLGRQEP
jgi:hypothetical protein